MKRMIILTILLAFGWALVSAQQKYPVDISYMVSDFKYSKEHGLKICEVQHGALSGLKGDAHISRNLGRKGAIPPAIATFFDHLPTKRWAAGVSYPPLHESLAAKGWKIQQSMKTLAKNPEFLACAALPPADPSTIASYACIAYATCDIAKHFDTYHSTYPGALFLDAATLPYWVDKYKMSMLFNYNDELKKYKADWRLYPKTYEPQLAEKIHAEMPSELYVIKPRKEFLGNGVIIVTNAELDRALQTILEPQASLKQHPDSGYSYWWTNKDDSFLIEKYYASDCLQFSHKLSDKADASISDGEGGYHYDATMRIAFILKYDQGTMTYHCMGGFWKLPCKALEEEGDLNEKRISFGAPPFYRAVDPELLKEINVQMERAMLLLYEAMLHAG